MANPNPSQQNSRTSTNTTLVGGAGTIQYTGDPFQVALEKFIKDNPKKDLTEFKSTTYKELCKAVGQIQEDQDKRREMMNMSRIQSCLEAMHQFGKVVDVFLNASNLVAFVWGPMKLLLLVKAPINQKNAS